ncbi:hypothetical protein [Psychrobacter sp. 72-O-c]|uniref:hypothetical protein n=1 Tax=Psychrobacter sp. 72-O-c TaxID=2774125 RepID=UPI001917DE5F|nr:hypothetical protein [Psychrobacter sp. 72-O-c]
MRYLLLAVLVTGSAALSGCFNDNDNDFETRDPVNTDVAVDQANAKLAVKRVSAVINTSKNVNVDEPQDIDGIILPEANLAEPVAITDANSSL